MQFCVTTYESGEKIYVPATQNSENAHTWIFFFNSNTTVFYFLKKKKKRCFYSFRNVWPPKLFGPRQPTTYDIIRPQGIDIIAKIFHSIGPSLCTQTPQVRKLQFYPPSHYFYENSRIYLITNLSNDSNHAFSLK